MQSRTQHALGFLFLAAGLVANGSWAGPPTDRMVEGRQAYEDACAKCHDHGSQGAPVTNNPDHWASRSDLWEGVLFEHARKGYINMPAKGGDPTASDYDVNAAAEYMLTITHPAMHAD